jgi:hypothetical protein
LSCEKERKEMKSFAVLFAIFAVTLAQAPPPSVDGLFSESWTMQQRLSPRQQLVDSEVTELRESLTNVLDVRTTEALEEIENNTRAVVELERPYRVILTSLPDTPCRNNLLSSLSLATDWSGFESSICVRRYYDQSEVVTSEAQEFIALYEGLFVRLQKVVIESFERRNAFSQQTEIVDRFNVEYNRRLAEWDAIRPQAEDFEANLDATMVATHSTMDTCMETTRDNAVASYESVMARIPTCDEFNN